MLWQDWLAPTSVLVEVSTPDGEGGMTKQWMQDGEEFDAAIVRDSSPEDRIAEKQGTDPSFTVTLPTHIPAAYHTVIKQGCETFRLTSNCVQTPDRATFSFKQASAERWDVPW